MNATDKPKCTAADGKTEVHNMPGVGLVVSAAAFNALVRDAERYRWLRRGGYPIQFAQSVLNDTPFGIDAAIDAAMQEKQS